MFGMRLRSQICEKTPTAIEDHIQDVVPYTYCPAYEAMIAVLMGTFLNAGNTRLMPQWTTGMARPMISPSGTTR